MESIDFVTGTFSEKKQWVSFYTSALFPEDKDLPPIMKDAPIAYYSRQNERYEVNSCECHSIAGWEFLYCNENDTGEKTVTILVFDTATKDDIVTFIFTLEPNVDIQRGNPFEYHITQTNILGEITE